MAGAPRVPGWAMVLPGLLALELAACGTAPRLQPTSRLDAEYLNGGFGRSPRAATATAVYRGVLPLGSRCQMFPNDSRAFDQRAERCGATAATVLGVARLYLETAGDPRFLPSTVAGGRVRWIDLPGRSCAP